MASSDLTLYFHPTSFYSQKVLLALCEKGVPYNKHIVEISQGENYAPWYMTLNSKGQVPLLKHGDAFIADSKAITDFIDKNFDGPTLVPKTHESETNELVTLIDSINIPILTFGSVMHPELTKDPQIPPATMSKMKAKVVNNAPAELFKKYMSECKDNPALQSAYKAKIDSKFLDVDSLTKDKVMACLDHASHVLAALEERLEGNAKDSSKKKAWLISGTFSAADIALAVCLQRLTYVGFAHRLLGPRPYVSTYRQRLIAEKEHFVRVCIEMKTGPSEK